MLETIGTIMIVRIRIAANMFEPTVGFVLKIGIQPNVPWIAGPRVPVMNGPSTRIPQSPRTTLGIAASSSTSGATAWRIQAGASSLRKRAMASEMGVARSSAPNDVTSGPEDERLGAEEVLPLSPQASVVRKCRPNFCIAGQASTRTSRVMSAEEDDAGERGRARDHVEDRVARTQAAPPLKGGGAGCSFLRDRHPRDSDATSGLS